MQRATPLACAFCCLLVSSQVHAILDKNTNGVSDVWEEMYAAQGLNPNLDSDGDGFTNLQEAIAGTNPFDPKSHPTIGIGQSGAQIQSSWPTVAGKRYQVMGNASLDPAGWQILSTITGTGTPFVLNVDPLQPYHFFKLQVSDLNTAGDGLTDWEKLTLGLDPTTQHNKRFDQTDFQRFNAAWNLSSTITVGVVDGSISKGWPDNGVIAIRRSGGVKAVNVHFTLGGTAQQNVDYTANATNVITVPMGATETWVQFTPIPDSVSNNGTKTITLTLTSGTGYTVSTPNNATVNIADEPSNAPPNPKAAARFLVQAAFGPDQDTDSDQIPQNVQQVMSLGYNGWIDAEFAKPATYLQKFVDASTSLSQYYADSKTSAWWGRAMGKPEIPGGPAVQNDALRHRIAFCLSQILVTSDNPETLAVQYSGCANYYDLFVKHAFGNYRNLLYDVTRHPVMGFFLSSLKNQKANPAANLYPDENYAREVMQLFSIGLWKLNQDGTRMKDAQGQDIPTYDNTTITNMARVFTGMTFYVPTYSGNSFLFAQENWSQPMSLWDAYHDCNAKTLLDGATLPQRTASSPEAGTATDADLNGALDMIFNHPNVGPFIGKLLIQRLVTSNPSPAYVGRVSAAFANNGSGVRGDMKAVIKAILLDDEARNPSKMSDPNFGKLREPFMRCVNFGRAFNATAQVDYYTLSNFYMDHYEEPMKSPSVFNFYLPDYTPPGVIQNAGLVSPEYQIINATSAISAPNYFYNAITGGLNRYGSADPTRTVNINTTAELALISTNNTDDLDKLIRRLDLALTYGTLSPQQFQIVREAVLRISTSTFQWQIERMKLAIYLIVTSPEFCVAR